MLRTQLVLVQASSARHRTAGWQLVKQRVPLAPFYFFLQRFLGSKEALTLLDGLVLEREGLMLQARLRTPKGLSRSTSMLWGTTPGSSAKKVPDLFEAANRNGVPDFRTIPCMRRALQVFGGLRLVLLSSTIQNGCPLFLGMPT